MTTAPSDSPGVNGRRRSARRTFASTVLVLEVFVVFFATLVAFGIRAAPAGVVWGVGGALAVVLVLASGTLRRPGGFVLGSIVQGLVLAGGVVLLAAPGQSAAFLAATTLVVGLMFVALWITALRLGGRIDRERAEWDAAHPDG